MKLSPKTNKKKANSRYWVVAGIILVLVVILGYFAYAYVSKDAWPFKATTTNTASENRDINDVDYGPPSQEDVDKSQTGKQNATNEDPKNENNSPVNSSTKKSVAVGVPFADVVDNNVEIRAFTPGIIEGGGKCTAQLQKGSKIVTATSEAFIDSSSSQCNPIYINLSSFPEKGEWSLTVQYSSNSAEGTSEKIGVTI